MSKNYQLNKDVLISQVYVLFFFLQKKQNVFHLLLRYRYLNGVMKWNFRCDSQPKVALSFKINDMCFFALSSFSLSFDLTVKCHEQSIQLVMCWAVPNNICLLNANSQNTFFLLLCSRHLQKLISIFRVWNSR